MKKEIPNCSGCTNYNCKRIRENGGYKYWYCLLEWLYGCDAKRCGRSTALKRELMKAGHEFLSECKFFGPHTCHTCDVPYGQYIWHFAIKMKQFQLWKLREFQEGYDFGFNPKKPYRDANPYLEPERRSSWDCGYILGLHENKISGS